MRSPRPLLRGAIAAFTPYIRTFIMFYIILYIYITSLSDVEIINNSKNRIDCM